MVRTAAEPLARTLVTLITACGLEKVFLFGGFADLSARRTLTSSATSPSTPASTPSSSPASAAMIEMAEPDDETCLRGAAIFAARENR